MPALPRCHETAGVLTVAYSPDELRREIFRFDQVTLDRFGPALAQREVVCRRAGWIGESLDGQKRVRVLLAHHAREAVGDWKIFRSQVCPVEAKIHRHGEANRGFESLNRDVELPL